MNPMDRILKKARLRIVGQSWLNHLVWCMTVAFAMAAIAIGATKIRPFGFTVVAGTLLAVAAIFGILMAGLIAILKRPDKLRTATMVDSAFGLKDRLSSVVNLPDEMAQTPAGQCLKAETDQAVETIDLAAGLGLKRPRRSWMPLIPLSVAGLVILAPAYVGSQAKSGVSAKSVDEAVSKKTDLLAKKIAGQRKAQAEKVSAPTAELMAELQKAAEDLAKSPPAEKSEALAALNQLSDAVKERQKQLGSTEKMASQLQQMKSMASDGPADEFTKDLAKGKFEEAANELKSLAEKAQNGKLTDQEKKQLQQQLGDMAKQIDKMANQDEKKKQLEEALKNGGLTKQQFQEEMAKLNQQASNMKQMQELAKQMQQAQQSMQEGNMQKAGESLKQAQEQLQQMAQQMSDMKQLDEALADLQEAKDGMSQDGKSNQLGDAMAQGNSLGDMMGDIPNGNGLNRGRGQGDRPEAPDKTSSYETRVKAELGKGKYQLKGFGQPGEQTKGRSIIEGGDVQQAVTEAAADALTQQRIPRKLQKNVRDYFDQIQKPQ